MDSGPTSNPGSTTTEVAKHGEPARTSPTWRAPAYLVVFLMFLIANTLSGHTHSLNLPIGPDRILIVIGVLILILDPRTQWRRLRFTSAHAVALLVVFWAAGSAYQSGTLETSLGGFALLDRLVIPYVMFTLGTVIFPDRESRMMLLQVLTVLGMYLGITAVFEVVGPHELVLPRYIMNPDVGISFGRARGPFLAADANGAAMAICLFAAIATVAVTGSRAWKWIGAVAALLCVAGVFLTLTRAVWLGTAVAFCVAALLHRRTRRLLPVVLAVVGVAVLTALVVSPGLRAKVVDRATTEKSVYDRQNTDAAAIRAIKDKPLTGIGWLQFIALSDRYVRQSRNYPITTTDIEVHNVVLSRLAELGIIGGGLWILSVCLGPLAAILSRYRRDRHERWLHAAYVGAGISWLVQIQFSPFPYPLPNTLVWLLAGLVLGPAGASGRSRSELVKAIAAPAPSS